MIDTSGSDWITYYPDPERKQEMPKSGFVEFTNTFNPDEMTIMDMNIDCIERNVTWNRAAPVCVAKYRFITEEDYLQRKLNLFKITIDNIEGTKKKYIDAITEIQKKLEEIYNKRAMT